MEADKVAGPLGSASSEGLGAGAGARPTLPASLAGRCANGYERGQGVRVHAVPYTDDLARNGYAIQRALCGAKPGPRSAGWSYSGMRLVTCPTCLRALERAKQLDDRDWCTDPDNCRRCKAPVSEQTKLSHAGIPVGPQRAPNVW
jgi:hypothetical protein